MGRIEGLAKEIRGTKATGTFAQCEPEGKVKPMALEAGHTLFLHGVNPNMQVSFLLNYQRKKKEIGFQVNRLAFVIMIIIVTIALQLKCTQVRELRL